jgi:predicted PurR-regulated permease PerM
MSEESDENTNRGAPDKDPNHEPSTLPNHESSNLNHEPKNIPNQASVSGEGSTKNGLKSSRFFVLLLIAIIGFAFFNIVGQFLVPVVLATVFTGLLQPIYKWLLRHLRKNRVIASMLCCFFLVMLVLIPLYIIVQLLARQLMEIYVAAEPFVKQFAGNWRENEMFRPFLQSRIGQWIVYETDWNSIIENFSRNAAGIVSTIVNRTYTGIFGLAVDLIIMLFVIFYFLLDGDRLLQYIKSLLPLDPEYQDRIVTQFVLISRATIMGTLVIGLVDGFLGAITLLIFGIPDWLFWGFMIAVMSIVPLVGPTFILVPAALIQILLGHVWQGIGILVLTYVVVINADNVVRPRIVGRSAKMHDLLVFFSTLGGLSIYGISGFIIGPIIAAVFLAVLEIYRTEFRMQSPK